MDETTQTMQQPNAMSTSGQFLYILKRIQKVLAWPFLVLITTYRVLISPLLGQNCRFHPTCSCYAHQAIEQHGIFRGLALAIKRIVKCHPLHPGGFDPVPGKPDDSIGK